MTQNWNANVYSQFLDLRTQPARDLLAAFPASFQPKRIYDLGCGPGNSTILLKQRWPDAEIIGLDSSENMLLKAKELYPELKFICGNIAEFSVDEKVDCLFANASLQWLDQHQILIPKLLQYITCGGAFGFQMPNNFHAPTHQITLRLLQTHKHWQPLMSKLRYGELQQPFYHLSWYYDCLTQAGALQLKLWETEYWQEMPDHEAIFNWVQGTGLRAIWSALDTENQALFKEAYIAAIEKEYPLQCNQKVLLPFRRIFMVGILN